MEYDQIGRVLLGVGGAIMVAGLVFFLLGRTGLGRLPGDFSFTSGPVTCVFPVATMILLSVVLTIIVNVVLRLFNR